MNFTERFKKLAGEMSNFLEGTTVEILVQHGFRVGTAGKVITYGKDELENTTIDTLKDLTQVMEDVGGGDLNKEFGRFLDEAFILIEKAPRTKLLKETGFSPSTIAAIRGKGADGNYQTSKFLIIADVAQKYKDHQQE